MPIGNIDKSDLNVKKKILNSYANTKSHSVVLMNFVFLAIKYFAV